MTIKHGFLIHLHLLDTSGSLKPSLLGMGFNITLGVQQMLMHRKNMFDPYIVFYGEGAGLVAVL